MFLPQLFSLRDIPRREEAHVGEPSVLMLDEHLDRGEVGRAVVVYEPGDVAVLVCVDAVRLAAILYCRKKLRMKEEVTVKCL